MCGCVYSAEGMSKTHIDKNKRTNTIKTKRTGGL